MVAFSWLLLAGVAAICKIQHVVSSIYNIQCPSTRHKLTVLPVCVLKLHHHEHRVAGHLSGQLTLVQCCLCCVEHTHNWPTQRQTNPDCRCETCKQYCVNCCVVPVPCCCLMHHLKTTHRMLCIRPRLFIVCYPLYMLSMVLAPPSSGYVCLAPRSR